MKRFNQILVILGGAIYVVLAVFNISISLFLRDKAEFLFSKVAFGLIIIMIVCTVIFLIPVLSQKKARA